ncbi:MAG: alpha-hydroxy-acid oxidizing protein [Gammaproteobacteria bacterium]|nr:alpha-hydroxy-acid oxidizing protein [Gammaproteobacteria bacterium]
MSRYPSIQYLERAARRRIPFFAWEYLASGTGIDRGVDRNIEALQSVQLTPRFMQGVFEPDLRTELFGRHYDAPFGIAPVGLTSLMWPGAERILARSAARYRIPFSLSTVATETPETIGPLADGMAWFQLYPPRNPEIRRDLLARAADAGFTTLLVTCDVPASSRRERQVHAEVAVPPRRTVKTYLRAAIRPSWSINTLQRGLPRFHTLEKYAPGSDLQQISAFMSQNFNGSLDWDYLRACREEWPGPVLVKGVLDVEDARRAVEIGLDGIVVSNHGARQFDGAPASIDVLPAIAAAVAGKTRIVFDSGVRGGLDICRALALGADFVLLGRAFIFAVAALGEHGGDHAIELLLADMQSNLSQLGCARLDQLPSRLTRVPHLPD